MKKCPKSLSLVLMTSLALGGLGCSNEPEAEQKEEFRTFSTVGECIRSGAFTDAQCEEEFKLALAQTPKFTSLADCEQNFGAGNCGDNPLGQAVTSAAQAVDQTVNNAAEAVGLAGTAPAGASQNGTAPQQLTQNSAYQSGGSWMPLMAGFMMGRMLSGGGMFQGSQPLFRDKPQAGGTAAAGGTSFRTATGDVVKPDAAGRVGNPGTGIRKGFQSTAKPVVARGTTSSRSGFGSSSSYGTSSGS
ncbi:DUF1190 domain-containing protein [Desulfovibrio cuneatus]|uniref:DUF1190 domain-containing protein n=1 Tax=Desulfovibrio cuneatus TaxID=159728 RepID=UPI00040EC5A3|nr:DUF1190 domain-containing protein [Desulfovibrio cuneatus]